MDIHEQLKAEEHAAKRLLPCPFCGIDKESGSMSPRLLMQEYGYIVNCPNCMTDKRVYTQGHDVGSINYAVFCWNCRAGDPLTRIPDETLDGAEC